MQALDLYAKIEPYIGFYEAYEVLYQKYLQLIKPLHVSSVLDVGCGNGKFLVHLQKAGYKALGIEQSEAMVAYAKKLGVDAMVCDISTLQDASFDCVVAIGDVLNYMNTQDLLAFFSHVSRVLKPQGYLLADINTHQGFLVAEGAMSSEDANGFLSIEALYEHNILTTKINFFEKKDTLYERYEGEIRQFYHPKSTFKNLTSLKLQKTLKHIMFSDVTEKEIIIFTNNSLSSI